MKREMKYGLNLQMEDGSESIAYENAHEAVLMVKDCYEQERITGEDCECFLEELLDRWGHRLPSEVLIALAEVLKLKITPHFAICSSASGKEVLHGFIKDEANRQVSPPLHFKEEGYYFLQFLCDEGFITEGQKEEVRKSITKSPLFHLPHEN